MEHVNKIHILFGDEFSHKQPSWWKDFLKEHFQVQHSYYYVYTMGCKFNFQKDLKPIVITNLGDGYFHQEVHHLLEKLRSELNLENILERDIFLHVNNSSTISSLLSGVLGDVIYYYFTEGEFMRNISKSDVEKIFGIRK